MIAGRRVLIVRNSETAPEGAFGTWLAEGGARIEVMRGEDLPAREAEAHSADLVVLLGSPHGVYDTHIPWVAAQRGIVARLAEAGRPIIGICFGAQMLAAATGGHAEPIGQSRAFLGVFANEEAADERFRGPFVRWHGDHFRPPPGAEVIARDGGTVQAFRHANRIGVQFHPEATAEIVKGWVARFADRVDGPAVLAAAERIAPPHALFEEMVRSALAPR
ncbi:type 1 glutamine amidotransferase [Neoroseomonas rubea]|uniref:type 1 glutamine amidotransferase n=1 Tax=Neoroseomonas rubea TaxID=2748666 RepID=UPI0018E05EBA|nr:type 1 glutamine amidotransferase [Roseomonas rubea]